MSLKNQESVSDRAFFYKKEIESLGGNLIAVSKTFSPEKIKEAHGAGLSDFGENYLNEALVKTEELSSYDLRWHYLGRIQSGNLNKVVNRFHLIHSVVKLSHLKKINEKTKNPQRVLIQIMHPTDVRDYGVVENDLMPLVQEALKLQNIKLSGLMYIPPVDMPDDELDRSFSWAYEHFSSVKSQLGKLSQNEWTVLSMGMSEDYKRALNCKATDVRLGRAIFGER